MNEIKKEKALRKIIREHINSIDDSIDKEFGKNVTLIKNKKGAAESVFNTIKSSELYEIFQPDNTYDSKGDMRNSIRGFNAGIGIAEYMHTTKGTVSVLEYGIDRLSDLFKISHTSFLQYTDAPKYKSALFAIVEDIINKKQLDKVTSCYKNIPGLRSQ
jgi:hypothetical protein